MPAPLQRRARCIGEVRRCSVNIFFISFLRNVPRENEEAITREEGTVFMDDVVLWGPLIIFCLGLHVERQQRLS